MKQFFKGVLLLTIFHTCYSQTNIISTYLVAENILLGNYNPADYLPSSPIYDPNIISTGIAQNIQTDSLKSYIIQLSKFKNRNTGSDTSSSTFGIGAARKWVLQKFNLFSQINENRLISSYLQFDRTICNVSSHKNIFAVLPGTDTTDKSIIIIEGHIDSRCEDVCDSLCNAQGIEDNASGTALVLELARVMSAYNFKHTVVFLITIGEEQGLYGADAFADYVQQKGIKVKAVLNNDVIGGIICGQTSSPPSCPGLNNIDSTHVRIFSFGNVNSKHKALARFIKLEYQEMIMPSAAIPMEIWIMTPEDRTGRGGDHMPFRQKNYAAIRFTSANEHGDAGVTDTAYADRQHTTSDTLGVDFDNNGIIDSFFVDFRYLKRNAIINGNAAAMLGIGPKQPDIVATSNGPNSIIIEISDQTQYSHYKIGVRSNTHDWDTLLVMNNTLTDTFQINTTNSLIYVQAMSVDDEGIESLPSKEYTVNVTNTEEIIPNYTGIELLQNRPNPFDEATYIEFIAEQTFHHKKAEILITDLSGKTIQIIPLVIEQGLNEVLYNHGYGVTGIYYYSLSIDGKIIQTKSMIFAN